MSPFDPYRDWLGIEPHEIVGGRVDHYRLLGLARFEQDAATIARAADERMALVRSFQVGPRKASTQKLLNELSAARICLLSPAAKTAYDADLRSEGVAPAVLAIAPPIVEPPVQPPPPPRAASQGDLAEHDDIGPASPWWRPIAAMLLASLAVLTTAVAWGIVQAKRPPEAAAVKSDSSDPPIDLDPPMPAQVVQHQEANGEVNFALAAAVLGSGVQLRTSGAGEHLAGFGSPQSQVQWKFRLAEPGFFQLELTYATAAGATGAALEAVVDWEGKDCELRSTGALDEFLTDSLTLAISKSGEHSLVLRPKRNPSGDWLVLKAVRLVPIGREPPPVLVP